MDAASVSSSLNSEHLRKIDLTHDLDDVADLIELCFPIQTDPDGQTYVREMRQAARDMRVMGWLSNLAEFDVNRASGFVWEEAGCIVGNLSLIPFQKGGQRIHLIANVAVHPDYRCRGIARALTSRAMGHLRRRNEPEVWLQVRDDNPTAMDLYRSVGFIDQVARTTWRIRPFEFQSLGDSPSAGLRLRRRRRDDWEDQQRWLIETYPLNIRWNLPVDFSRFVPGLIQSLVNLLEGKHFKHWAVSSGEATQGTITWQKTSSFANNLWLAFPEEAEIETLPWVLDLVMNRLPPKHPISIDYPKGRLQKQFDAMGFQYFRTLIWMRHQFK